MHPKKITQNIQEFPLNQEFISILEKTSNVPKSIMALKTPASHHKNPHRSPQQVIQSNSVSREKIFISNTCCSIEHSLQSQSHPFHLIFNKRKFAHFSSDKGTSRKYIDEEKRGFYR